MPQAVTQPYTEQRCRRRHEFADVTSASFLNLLGEILYRFGKRYRVEYIILKERTKCNMPSAPEITGILGKERLSEILRQCNSENLAASDYNVHTSRKFHIQLGHITDCAKKCNRTVKIGIIAEYVFNSRI